MSTLGMRRSRVKGKNEMKKRKRKKEDENSSNGALLGWVGGIQKVQTALFCKMTLEEQTHTHTHEGKTKEEQ